MSAFDSSITSTNTPCVDMDSHLAMMERGLIEWDDLCNDLIIDDKLYRPASEQAASEGLAGVEGLLRKVSRLLAKSHQAQAAQGKATMLLLRQTMANFQGFDMASFTQLAQGLRTVDDWAQQVAHLSTELRVQRYSWQQLHSQLDDTQAALQRSQLEILEKDQMLLLLQCELDLARQDQGSRLACQQALTAALQDEVLQLRLQLEVLQATAGSEQAVEGVSPTRATGDSKAQSQLAAERAANDELTCQVQQLRQQLDRTVQEHEAAHADMERQLSAAAAEAERAAAVTVAAAQASAQQAEAALASERELAESLTEELGLVQARLAALQQEHGALKRESALLAERTIMSEDGLEDARQAAEEAVQASNLQAAALRQELAAAHERIRELQAELDSSSARRCLPASLGPGASNGQGGGHHSKKNSSSGGPAAGSLSVEASPAKGASEQVHGHHRCSFEGSAAPHSHRSSFEGGGAAGGGGGLPPPGPHAPVSALEVATAEAQAAARAEATAGKAAGFVAVGDTGTEGAGAAEALPAALLHAEARAQALEQELHAVRQQLAALLAAGQQQCQAHGLSEQGETAAGDPNSHDKGQSAGEGGVAAAESSAASALLGVLRCTELLFTRQMHGSSLTKVRMLQAELEGVLQGALSPCSGAEAPAVLREIRALQALHHQCEASGAFHTQGQATSTSPAGRAHGEVQGPGYAEGVGGRGAADAGCVAEGWEDVDAGDSWFSHEHVSPASFQGPSSGGGVGRSPQGSSGGRDGGAFTAHVDDGLQDLEAMWELPPLPPPPQFD